MKISKSRTRSRKKKFSVFLTSCSKRYHWQCLSIIILIIVLLLKMENTSNNEKLETKKRQETSLTDASTRWNWGVRSWPFFLGLGEGPHRTNRPTAMAKPTPANIAILSTSIIRIKYRLSRWKIFQMERCSNLRASQFS